MQNQPNLTAKDLYEVLIDFDSLDGILCQSLRFSAPWVFTKTLAPLVAWLRLMGLQLYPYLDDILFLGESPREVEQSVQVMTQAGFIVNLKKYNLAPTQDLVYIGAILYRPRQGIPPRGQDRETPYPSPILCQGQTLLTSPPLPESPSPHGGQLQSVEYAHLHMRPHPVVPEVTMDHITHGLHLKIIVNKDLYQAL